MGLGTWLTKRFAEASDNGLPDVPKRMTTAGYLPTGTRATDADRSAAMTTLTKARAAGCINLAQYEARLADAQSVNTAAQLGEITKDLPKYYPHPANERVKSTKDIIVDAVSDLSNKHTTGFHAVTMLLIATFMSLAWLIPLETTADLGQSPFSAFPALGTMAGVVMGAWNFIVWHENS